MLGTKVVMGLGNPGARYRNTRHNAGFLVLDALAGARQAGPWRSGCESMVTEFEAEGHRVLMAKPLTFMNLSGRAARSLLEHHRVEPKDLLVVLDDLNLPFGRIRMRARGSAGGHRGLDSILRSLGTEEVPRVRLGIGEESMPADRTEFVLSEFPRSRKEELDAMIRRCCEVVESALVSGPLESKSMDPAPNERGFE